MKIFRLNRKSDPSAVSGCGIVAYGVEFDNGEIVLTWRSERAAIEILHSASMIEAIHGHSGQTIVEYLPMSKQFMKKLHNFLAGTEKEKK